MPNQPSPKTIATCFTLPRDLLAIVEGRAKREMTNKSDIIRRALMNYLTPSERAWVQQQNAAGQFQGQSLRVAEEPGEGAIQQQQQMKPVSYKEALKKKPKAK